MNPAFSPAVTAGQGGWVSVLIFGFPVAMVLLGEAIRRLQRRRHPVLPAVRILRNWIIPSLTVFVLLAQVIGLPRSTVLVRVAETLVWITLIYGALTLLNAIMFEGAAEGSWQAKVPQLFRDLGRFVLVLVGSSIVLSTVWGADLGGFLTALGVAPWCWVWPSRTAWATSSQAWRCCSSNPSAWATGLKSAITRDGWWR
ncbi:MAG: hypothetical protein ACKOOH_02905 [Cyanobium sp.]